MCTPEGAAAAAKGMGSIGDGHAKNFEGQSRRFKGCWPLVRDKFGALPCADTCVADKRSGDGPQEGSSSKGSKRGSRGSPSARGGAASSGAKGSKARAPKEAAKQPAAAAAKEAAKQPAAAATPEEAAAPKEAVPQAPKEALASAEGGSKGSKAASDEGGKREVETAACGALVASRGYHTRLGCRIGRYLLRRTSRHSLPGRLQSSRTWNWKPKRPGAHHHRMPGSGISQGNGGLPLLDGVGKTGSGGGCTENNTAPPQRMSHAGWWTTRGTE